MNEETKHLNIPNVVTERDKGRCVPASGSAFALRRKGRQLPLDAFYATEREAEMAKGWQKVSCEELETLKVTYEVLPNARGEQRRENPRCRFARPAC